MPRPRPLISKNKNIFYGLRGYVSAVIPRPQFQLTGPSQLRENNMRKFVAAFFAATAAFMFLSAGTASATCLWTDDGIYLCDDAG